MWRIVAALLAVVRITSGEKLSCSVNSAEALLNFTATFQIPIMGVIWTKGIRSCFRTSDNCSSLLQL